MNANEVAFFIGLFGSIHCIGMCGPLALAVPVKHHKWPVIIADKLLYNTGRVITYTALGLFTGLVGKQLWLLGLQNWLSVLSGVIVIIAALSILFNFRLTNNKIQNNLMLPVNRALNYALQKHAGHLAIGLLNGFLPCGFVYLALVGALNTPTVPASAMYMLWFGLGTFPLMFLATLSSGFLAPVVRKQIYKAMPYFMVCLGCWFILRGLNLNIPYLSPGRQTGIYCR